MKYSKFLFFFFVVVLPFRMVAQDAYWVYLTDKKDVSFNPGQYFDPKAIERRVLNGLPINDITDWPVNDQYSSIVGEIADSALFSSRWFNAIAIYASENQVEALRQLPFVKSIDRVVPESMQTAGIQDFDTVLESDDAEILKDQLLCMQGNLFTDAGIDGKGIRIAIFDVGFPGAKENPALKKIIEDGRLKATHDFSKKKGEDVFWGKSHGTNVWSCIAGKVGDKQIGLATGAEFLLAKTEVNREPFSEELHWLAAAEWADKNGADIINSSLGYTKERYFPWSMDGKTSFISRAANMAARKGILVVNAAGNEGSGDWHTVGAPADADSVLSIGGIDPETGYHIGFSSFGPTADKRMKPNVCAYGKVVVSGGSGLESSQGTSFASPLVAGFSACALQLNKGMKNMTLFHEIEKSGNLYPYFDYAHGFGVPQAGYFLNKEKRAVEPTFSILESPDSVKVVINKELIPGSGNKNGDMHANNPLKNNYLYYNIMNKKGVLDSYYIVEVSEPDVLVFSREDYKEGETLNVYFEGYTHSCKF
jgi:serine protease AprX